MVTLIKKTKNLQFDDLKKIKKEFPNFKFIT